MYIDYSKLWKLLVDKNMNKSDLIALTGISSRVIAKMSKNETITTDTIARICSALNCSVSDIMECISEENLTVYAAYKKYGVCVEENELFKMVQFSVAGQKYTVYQSNELATKATQIHCEEDKTVYWVQFYPVGHIAGMPVKKVLVKPYPKDNEIIIVLIKGKPCVIAGLDENGFVSSRGVRKNKSDIYVMSESAFKLFTPQVM